MNPKPVLYLEQYQDWLTQNVGDIVDVSMTASCEGVKFNVKSFYDVAVLFYQYISSDAAKTHVNPDDGKRVISCMHVATGNGWQYDMSTSFNIWSDILSFREPVKENYVHQVSFEDEYLAMQFKLAQL
jgi:hypothetical protein